MPSCHSFDFLTSLYNMHLCPSPQPAPQSKHQLLSPGPVSCWGPLPVSGMVCEDADMIAASQSSWDEAPKPCRTHPTLQTHFLSLLPVLWASIILAFSESPQNIKLLPDSASLHMLFPLHGTPFNLCFAWQPLFILGHGLNVMSSEKQAFLDPLDKSRPSVLYSHCALFLYFLILLKTVT